MNVLNVHERSLPVPPSRAGALLDSLSGASDALWPRHSWPKMALDRPLSIGADGGHGPVRYEVIGYEPGASVRFRFKGPAGFEGTHAFEVIARGEHACVLRHTLAMAARGPALLSWPLVFRPLHDAVLEDSMALAQASLGLAPDVRPWSPWVRALRRLTGGGRARPQPDAAALAKLARDRAAAP